MSISIVSRVGDLKVFGAGELGGKGGGLAKINASHIPEVHKLRTRILSTIFYDRFQEQGGCFGAEELKCLSGILREIGNFPISVRSSATNEAYVAPGRKGSVRAGENTSFMLPNNNPEFKKRFHQLTQAVYFIYRDFIRKQPGESKEKMAIVINPIPGTMDNTQAGPVYYPQVSGVANSYFFHALRSQNPEEGFARIAFGHGYATVLDDFPVISVATIRNPLPVQYLSPGQKYFYAINMRYNDHLEGQELETMKKLHLRFASSSRVRCLGAFQKRVTFTDLVEKDGYAFRSQLCRIMETISERISKHFQIEFIFNIPVDSPRDRGIFHIVQLTQLPQLRFERINLPERVEHTYLSTDSLQGHGIKKRITHAVVISPFQYSRAMHDEVRVGLARVCRTLKESRKRFIVIIPGRLGSKNRDWGIQADYSDIEGTAAIFEYGVDIAGRAEPVADEGSMKGGIYGSHFLYMIQGGFDEEKKRSRTRMYGTQGTHFLTNLVSNNVIYGYIAPGSQGMDPWFFIPPPSAEIPYVLQFPVPASIYADSINRVCKVVREKSRKK